MIEANQDPVTFSSQQTTVFSPTQFSAIKFLVSASVPSALSMFQLLSATHLPSSLNQRFCNPGITSPLGLSRPLDMSIRWRTKYSGEAMVTQTMSFNCNKLSGCRCHNCSYPHKCCCCYTTMHAAPDFPQQHPTKPNEHSKK